MRARRVAGKGDDSVVKLRPVVPSELPRELRESPECVVEVDAMPGGLRLLGVDEGHCRARRSATSRAGNAPLRKLFSKEQRAFFAEHAPEGIGFEDLSLLGPIFVLKLKGVPEGFARKMVVELWLYPDGTRILELSTKCATDGGLPGRRREPRLPGRARHRDRRRRRPPRRARRCEFFSKQLTPTG